MRPTQHWTTARHRMLPWQRDQGPHCRPAPLMCGVHPSGTSVPARHPTSLGRGSPLFFPSYVVILSWSLVFLPLSHCLASTMCATNTQPPPPANSDALAYPQKSSSLPSYYKLPSIPIVKMPDPKTSSAFLIRTSNRPPSIYRTHTMNEPHYLIIQEQPIMDGPEFFF